MLERARREAPVWIPDAVSPKLRDVVDTVFNRDERLMHRLVDALATFRIVRLAQHDTILDRPRERLDHWLARNNHHRLAELASCSWCLSVWVAAAVVIARRTCPRAWAPVADGLAIAAAAALIAEQTADRSR